MRNSINTDIVKSSRKPLLIHIGYHKTASTWLQKSIFQSTNGFFQPFKLRELYNCLILPNALSFDYRKAKRSLEARTNSKPENNLSQVLSHERLSGDPFTGSRDAKDIANRVHTIFPEAKILILVREQFDLISSLYKTYVLHGGKAKLDAFLKTQCDEVNQWFDHRTYCYDKLITHYIEMFGRENVLVVAYEELKNDNQGFYNDLCEFVGIPQGTLESRAIVKVNSGLSEFGIEMLRLVNLSFGVFCAYPLDPSNNQFWRIVRSTFFRMEWIFKRIPLKGRYKQRTKKILSGKFKASNSTLQAYVSLDLANAGYER